MDANMSILTEPEVPHACSFLFRSNRDACSSARPSSIKEQLATQDQAEQLQVQTVKLPPPIECLPSELLSEIFEQCLDVRNSSMVFSTAARNQKVPLFLGRVCRYWRTVTLATPRLWRNIFVNVCDGRYAQKLRADAIPILQMCLARSGKLHLSLVIVCKTERMLPGLVDLFEVIGAHAARWKTVHVRLQNSPMIFKVVSHAFTRCTSLSTFDITDGGQSMLFFENRQLSEAEDIHFDLSLAPLHQLSLSLAGLTIHDVHAPWATLTRLSFMQHTRLSTCSITDYVTVLQQCRSLKECSIAIDSGIRDGPLQSFTLPRLERLQLQVRREAAQTTQMDRFLSILDAPRLSALTIEDYCPREEAVVYQSSLKAFLNVHTQSLRHLRFSTCSTRFASEDMLALIAETPLLTELEYRPEEGSSPKTLLGALTPRTQGDVIECLLPGLERFFVYWDTTETVSMVGEMVEKRYALVERGISPFKYLSCKPVKTGGIVCNASPSRATVENLAARLQPLCRRGPLRVDWEAYRYNLEFLYC